MGGREGRGGGREGGHTLRVCVMMASAGLAKLKETMAWLPSMQVTRSLP